MTRSRIRHRVIFPDPSTASPDGIVAVGASPTADILKEAYQRGIFPWPHDGYPLLWFSPDPRFVLELASVHLHRSLKKAMRKTELVIRADTAFRSVIEACASKERPAQKGTWITPDMVDGYCALHAEGFAHSIEAWRGTTLVGGLYGVSFGSVFFGESMFQTEADASKIAFATLLGSLARWDFSLVDCQSYTSHLERFGAVHWPRAVFLDALSEGLEKSTRQGPWSLEVTASQAADLFTAPLLPDD